ncbi:hypothetical protein LZ30DRAFT_355846 [Colletotrichum cereale]|nr:hypothetical protein LZ30DRAFT_355846 [Colletotrichum cereale]
MDLLRSDPSKFLKLIQYASTFPDYPKGFVFPALADPNYVPPNHGGNFVAYSYAMAILTTVVVIARLWVRRTVKGLTFGLDDWLMIPGQIVSLGMIASMVLLVKLGGVGMHTYDVSYARIYLSYQIEFAAVLLYVASIFFIRMSITAFLYRLMALGSTTKRILLIITYVLLVLQFIIQTLVYVFAYKPIAANWDFDVRLAGFTSINISLEFFILTIFNLFVDIWLLFLPIHTIWNMNMGLRARIGILWIFFFGAIACVGAAVRTAYIHKVFDSWDALWNGVGVMYGALTEISFGLVSASMPALNHIIVKWLPKLLNIWSKDGSGRPPKSFKESFHGAFNDKQRTNSMGVAIPFHSNLWRDSISIEPTRHTTWTDLESK